MAGCSMTTIASTTCQSACGQRTKSSASHVQHLGAPLCSTAFLNGRQLWRPVAASKSSFTLKVRARRNCYRARAMLEAEGELVPEVDAGTRIRVTKEVTVYHAPKRPELQLKGMEGTVKQIVKKFKGKETSANLPYKIEFMLDQQGGKQQKLLAHLVGTLQNSKHLAEAEYEAMHVSLRGNGEPPWLMLPPSESTEHESLL